MFIFSYSSGDGTVCNSYVPYLIKEEYRIQLSAFENVEPHSHKSKDGGNRGDSNWVRVINIQKNRGIYSLQYLL